MNVQEYQAKNLFKAYQIPVLKSQVAGTAKEARKAGEQLGGSLWVVKAQVLAGGRGKAGGVKVVKDLEELEQVASSLLGKNLVTAQTTSEGEPVEKILIETACSIEEEYYLSLLVNPKNSRISFMVSPEGGVDIEEVSSKQPEKILMETIHPFLGFQAYQAWSIGTFLGLSEKQEISQVFSLCKNLYQLFTEKDATLLEINPLVKDKKGRLIALDGKIGFDENSLYRHEDLTKIYGSQKRKESESQALEYGLSFIELEGDIGCMVNGAGLAMATMDIIKTYGGSPANFLDVGGGADEQKVKKAFEIILKSKEVKAILVNIFGGIMRCDVLASGLIKACQAIGLKVPVVIRLEGTKSKEGLKLLQESNLNLITAKNLAEAAQKVVEISKK
ncbi:MAG: ADP-forming succinate--CoA ligase subunit beta [Bdellovibrionales bacterium]